MNDKSSRLKTLITVGAVGATAAVAMVGFVSGSGASATPDVVATPSATASSVSGAPEGPILEGLSGLSDAPRASDDDAAATTALMDDQSAASSARGADLLPTVVEVTRQARRRTIVAAGPKYVCVKVIDPTFSSGACTTHASAVNSTTPMVDVTKSDDGFVVSAVVPDGVSSAAVQTRDMLGASVPIRHNALSTTVATAPRTLRLMTTSGRITVNLSSANGGSTE